MASSPGERRRHGQDPQLSACRQPAAIVPFGCKEHTGRYGRLRDPGPSIFDCNHETVENNRKTAQAQNARVNYGEELVSPLLHADRTSLHYAPDPAGHA